MTRTSGILGLVAQDAQCTTKQIRYSSIPCNLRSVLLPCAGPLHVTFNEYAQSNGMYRRVVSLVANHLLIHRNDPIEDWFNFYLEVWAAVAFYFSPKGMAPNWISPIVEEMFRRIKPTDAMRELLSSKSPAMTRQQEANVMATNAKLHLKLAITRLRSFTRAAVVGFQATEGRIDNDAEVARLAVECIISTRAALPALETKLSTICHKYDPSFFADWVLPFVRHERDLLGDLVATDVVRPISKKRWTLLESIVESKSNDKLMYLLLPCLRRYSRCGEAILHERGPVIRKPSAAGAACATNTSNASGGAEAAPADESDEEESDDEEEEPDTNKGAVPWSPLEKKRWGRTRRPKPFQILPVCKLQRSMVYYGWTEIRAMFSALYAADKKESNQAKKKKRKRDPQAEPAPQLPYYATPPDQFDPFQSIFDTSGIKGKHKGRRGATPRWRLCCFRTNGVKCVLTFASGMPDAAPYHGAEGLLEVGYSGIKAPDAKIDVRTTARGLFRIKETRNDMKPLGAGELGNVEYTACDPGFDRVVQCASVSAACDPAPERVAKSMVESGQMWHYTQDEWVRESGRQVHIAVDANRRVRSVSYSAALKSFEGTRKRTADPQTFSSYMQTAFETFGPMVSELLHKGRSISSWQADRALQQFLSRVADRMMKTSSTRIERTPDFATPRTDEETRALRERLSAAKERARKVKQVVLFGDGTFKSSMRGRVSVPKKSILKALAARGLTFLLGEYKTSKTCPCGQDDLKTPSGSSDSRVRVHKTSGGQCAVLLMVRNRDETAAVQFLCCGIRSVRGQAWPAHLRFPVRT